MTTLLAAKGSPATNALLMRWSTPKATSFVGSPVVSAERSSAVRLIPASALAGSVRSCPRNAASLTALRTISLSADSVMFCLLLLASPTGAWPRDSHRWQGVHEAGGH